MSMSQEVADKMLTSMIFTSITSSVEKMLIPAIDKLAETMKDKKAFYANLDGYHDAIEKMYIRSLRAQYASSKAGLPGESQAVRERAVEIISKTLTEGDQAYELIMAGRKVGI